MSEKNIITKQLIKNMLLNLVVFSIIFILFGSLLYNVVSSSIYKSADNKLLEPKNNNEMLKFVVYNQNDYTSQEDESRIVKVELNTTDDKNIVYYKINPSIVYITRDKEWKIVSNTLDKSYNIDTIMFDDKIINKIYTLKLNNEYNYRAINYPMNDGTYIQMLVNVDSEIEIMNTFLKILIAGIVTCILLSVIASYLLSKITIYPIITSWRKQTEFVQNVSHELRTPISIIQGTQEMLLDFPNSKIIDRFEDINNVLKETKRLSNLIEDLMLLSMSDENKVEFIKENVLLDKLILDVCKPYTEYAKSNNKKLKLVLNYNEYISIDQDKLKQVLIILLDNAIKYTNENDEIEVASYKKGGKCSIVIKDTGIGISKEDRKYIFDRFYRADKARNKKIYGSGLGLSIAKFIVLKHNGIIKVSENTPKGTLVEVRLPKK